MPTRGAKRHSGNSKRGRAKPATASDPFKALAEVLWTWRATFPKAPLNRLDSKWGLALKTSPHREQVIEWLEIRGFFQYADELRSKLSVLFGQIVDLHTDCDGGKLEDERARDEAIQIVEGSSKGIAERVLEMQNRCRKVRRPAHKATAHRKRRQAPELNVELQRIKVGGKWCDLTEQQTAMLVMLFDAKGHWVPGKAIMRETLCHRPDKVRKSMSPAVAKLIESHRPDGYRISVLLPQ